MQFSKKQMIGGALVLASVVIIAFAIKHHQKKAKAAVVEIPIFKNGDVFFNTAFPESGTFIWGFKDGKWVIIEDVDFELMKADGIFSKSNSIEAFLKYPKSGTTYSSQNAFPNLQKYWI